MGINRNGFFKCPCKPFLTNLFPSYLLIKCKNFMTRVPCHLLSNRHIWGPMSDYCRWSHVSDGPMSLMVPCQHLLINNLCIILIHLKVKNFAEIHQLLVTFYSILHHLQQRFFNQKWS